MNTSPRTWSPRVRIVGAVVVSVMVGAVGFVEGLGYPSTLWGSVLVTGLIASVPGLLLGVLDGTVLFLDVYRRSSRPA